MGLPKAKVSAKYESNLKLKRARESRGWAQADLAERIGAQTNLVTRWERGYAFPSPYYRQKICEIFGESAENLGLIKEERKSAPSSDAITTEHAENVGLSNKERLNEGEEASSPLVLQQREATDVVQTDRKERLEESVLHEMTRRTEASEPDRRKRRFLSRRNLLLGGLILGVAAGGGTVGWWLTHRSQGVVLGPVPVTYRTPRAVNDVDWSPDGALLACAEGDNAVRIRIAATGQMRYMYDNNKVRTTKNDDSKDFINCVRWSPDQQLVAFASADKTVKVWNPASDATVLSYHGDNLSGFLCVAWSPTGRLLASSGDNPTVWVWDLSGKTIATCHGHSARVWIVAWSPDGQSIASCGVDGTIRAWEAFTGKESNTFRYPGDHSTVNEVAWSPDGKLLAAASGDAKVRILDALTGSPLLLCQGHTASVQTVKWSPNGKLLASGSIDGTVRIWDALTGEQILLYPYHSAEVYAVSWSPDGKLLASGSLDNTLQIYRIPFNG